MERYNKKSVEDSSRSNSLDGRSGKNTLFVRDNRNQSVNFTHFNDDSSDDLISYLCETQQPLNLVPGSLKFVGTLRTGTLLRVAQCKKNFPRSMKIIKDFYPDFNGSKKFLL